MVPIATRRERVVLELQDDFSTGMAKAAAETALLRRELRNLDGTSVKTSRSMSPLGDPNGPIGRTGRQSEVAGKQIDRLSGRIKLIAQATTILGPALVPIGAVGIPAVAGLAAQLGFAAVAGGTAIAAFQGVGDALKAMNKAHLEPTAENLEAAREAMQKLSPAAREAVVEMRKFAPALLDLRDAAATGFFPGFVDSLDAIRDRLPDVEKILSRVGDTVGEILSGGAESLASSRWDDFFEFLATDARSALSQLADAVGSVTHGLSELWMAFDPSNDAFSAWLVRVTRDFDEWAQGLSATDGFREFIDYVQTNGPRVADALSSMGNMLLQIVEASAPLGGPVLEALGAIADVIAAIANSDLGTPIMVGVAAMSLYSRAAAVATASNISFANSSLLSWKQTKLLAGGIGLAALAMTDLDDKSGLSNTAMLAMAGTVAGPWGAAVGAGAGFALDFAAANDEIEAAVRRVDMAMRSGTTGEQRAALRELKTATDAASAGFLDLLDPVKAISNPVDAAKSAFNLLSGATGRARDEIDQFHDHIKHRKDLGALLVGPLGLAEDAFLDADEAMRKFETSFKRLNNLLTRSDTLIAYEQALDDLTKSIKENGDTWDRSTNKGRENLLARNALVQTAIERSQKLREEGDKLGAQHILRRAMSDLEDFGSKSPKAKAAMSDLIAELDRLDKKRAEPKVDADTKPAHEKLSAAEKALARWGSSKGEATATVDGAQALATLFHVKGALDAIHSKTVFVNVETRRSNESGGFGATYAQGGFTGWGGKYEPAGIVHRGEVVIPQERVKADWSFLKSRYGDLPGFAAGGRVGGVNIGSAAQASTVGGQMEEWLRIIRRLNHMTDKELSTRTHLIKSLDDDLKQRRHELAERERMLTKELDQAEKKWQAERDLLKEMRDARRSLMQDVAGNFMSGLFGGVDLLEAIRTGALPSEVMAAVHAFSDLNGLGGQSMSDQVQAYLDSLSPEQIAALQGQATSATLSQDTRNAEQFQALLEQLAAMGLDGGLFQELAASGNISAAEYYATLTSHQIDALEQQYEQRNQAAQSVGQMAANAEFLDGIREQVKVARGMHDEVRQLRQSSNRVEKRIELVERAIEKLPKPIGREVGKAVNDAAATAARG